MEGQFLNYWNLRTSVTYTPQSMSRRQTRGGPMMVGPASMRWSVNADTDRRKRLSFGLDLSRSDDHVGRGGRYEIRGDVRVQPSASLAVSVNPRFEKSRAGDQYVTTTSTLPYAPTYGSRYIFADLDQTTLSFETRLNWTVSPTISLQLYAEPFISVGDYDGFKRWVARQSADGGGDEPENAVDAVMWAYNNIAWHQGSQRLLVVMTDAPTHSLGAGGSDRGVEPRPDPEALLERRGADLVAHPLEPRRGGEALEVGRRLVLRHGIRPGALGYESGEVLRPDVVDRDHVADAAVRLQLVFDPDEGLPAQLVPLLHQLLLGRRHLPCRHPADLRDPPGVLPAAAAVRPADPLEVAVEAVGVGIKTQVVHDVRRLEEVLPRVSFVDDVVVVTHIGRQGGAQAGGWKAGIRPRPGSHPR